MRCAPSEWRAGGRKLPVSCIRMLQIALIRNSMQSNLALENRLERTPTRRAYAAPLAFYLATLLGGIAAFFAIRWYGEGLVNESSMELAPQAGGSTTSVDVVFHVLATLAAVIALGRILSLALKWLGQPPVIGEVLAGIVL